MPTRSADAVWEGGLKDGNGKIKLGSGAYEGQYSFSSRFESGTGTNPEELIAGAHAGCFSMAFAAGLSAAGFTPTSVSTTAKVTVDKAGAGFKITQIALTCMAKVPNIDEAEFKEQADAAKSGCPVSQALSATPITLDARLIK